MHSAPGVHTAVTIYFANHFSILLDGSYTKYKLSQKRKCNCNLQAPTSKKINYIFVPVVYWLISIVCYVLTQTTLQFFTEKVLT